MSWKYIKILEVRWIGKEAINAWEKGKQSATHADNLTTKYGKDLKGKYKNKSLADAISSNIDDEINEVDKTPVSAKEIKKLNALSTQKAQLNDSLKQAEEGMTLADVSKTLDSAN